MTTANQYGLTPSGSITVSKWLGRGMEALWLLTVLLVPLVFLDRDYAKSEAIIGYVEVPKIALLRLLAGTMAVLWLVQWGIAGRLPVGGFAGVKVSAPRPSAWKTWLASYVAGNPHRWVILAVGFYLATTLISTVLSGSFTVSMWGEVPGQDGYSAYNVIAYILLFGVIATHLKTRPQLWRLLAAIVVMGVVVGGYSTFQNYGHDFLGVGEETGGRITAFMGNRLFAAAVLMMTIPISGAAAVVSLLALSGLGSPRLNTVGRWLLHLATLGIWASALSVQSLGLIFTFSRGPWLGTIAAITVMVGLVMVFVGRRALIRLALVFGLTLAVIAGVILDPSLVTGGEDISSEVAGSTTSVTDSGTGAEAETSTTVGADGSRTEDEDNDGLDVADTINVALDPTATAVADRFSSIRGEVTGGFAGGRGTHWKVSWRLIKDHPWFDFETLSLRWLRPIIGYGPDLFRYTYLLESPPEGPQLYPLEPDHAHNLFIHQTVEQGFLGLVSILGVFSAVVLAGLHQLIRVRQSLTPYHLLIVASLLAVVLGRFLEMTVGVARISDLTIFWVLLGVFAALPAAMQSAEEAPAPSPRNRRARGRNRSRAHQSSWAWDYDWNWVWRLAVVAWLVGGIVMLTWFKGVTYPLAAVKAAEAVGHWQKIDLRSTLVDLDSAIALAPDVAVYQEWRTSVYLAFAASGNGPLEKQCSVQNEQPYENCLALLAYQGSRLNSEQSPYYYRSRLFLANTAANLKRNEEAARYYRETTALVPGSWVIKNELAKAYMRQEQPGIALDSLRESLAITKDTAWSNEALFLQGLAYRAMGESQKWVESLEGSLEMNPNGDLARETRFRLAVFYIDRGDREQAIKNLSLNIRGNKRNPDGFINRGKAHFIFEEYELSLMDYEEAVQLGTSNPEANKLGENLAITFVSQGESLNKLGRYWPAISEFNRAIRADAQYPPAYRERGDTHRELGLASLAIRDFERAVRLDPDDEKARAYLDVASQEESFNTTHSPLTR